MTDGILMMLNELNAIKKVLRMRKHIYRRLKRYRLFGNVLSSISHTSRNVCHARYYITNLVCVCETLKVD